MDFFKQKLLFIAILFFAVTSPIAQSTWTRRDLQQQGNNLYGLAWSGTKFVSVGTNGSIIVSLDDTLWALRFPDTKKTLRSVAWTGSQFVVVGDSGIVLTSPNGDFWTTKPSGIEKGLFSVTWTESKCVAVGAGGVVLTSPDGSVWTSQTSGTVDSLFSVFWTGTQVVAAGANGTILTSPDGTGWTKRTSGTSDQLLSVCKRNSQIITVGPNGTIVTSLNGNDWVLQAPVTTKNLTSVVWTGKQLVALKAGIQDSVLISDDGISWKKEEVDLSLIKKDRTFRAAIWCGDRVFAVGDNCAMATTPNGRLLLNLQGSYSYGSVVWDGKNLLTSGSRFSSADGVFWNLHPRNVLAIGPQVWTGDKFMAFGYNIVSTSQDGLTWAKIYDGYLNLLSVIWTGTQYVGVGDMGKISTSPDGVTWTKRESGRTGVDDMLNSIAFNGSRYCVVGNLGKNVLTSTDCVTWTPVNIGVSAVLKSIIWTGTQFVAIGGSAVGHSGAILTTPDGITWTDRSIDLNNITLYSVAWNGKQFAATGAVSSPPEIWSGAVIYTSPDAVTWSKKYQCDESSSWLTSIIWAGTQFVAVGGSIVTSPGDSAPVACLGHAIANAGRMTIKQSSRDVTVLLPVAFRTTALDISILSLSGKRMVSFNKIHPGARFVFSTRSLPCGAYHAVVSCKGRPVEKLFVVNR